MSHPPTAPLVSARWADGRDGGERQALSNPHAKSKPNSSRDDCSGTALGPPSEGHNPSHISQPKGSTDTRELLSAPGLFGNRGRSCVGDEPPLGPRPKDSKIVVGGSRRGGNFSRPSARRLVRRVSAISPFRLAGSASRVSRVFDWGAHLSTPYTTVAACRLHGGWGTLATRAS